jgi:hypothetical protein
VQRHYLTQAEARLDAPYMPSWAPEVCRLWRTTLDRIENDRSSLATRLDWAIKRPLYSSHASRRGFTPASVTAWTRALGAIQGASPVDPIEPWMFDELVPRPRSTPCDEAETARGVRARGLNPDELPAFRALRRELFEIDMRFGEIGERGIFTSLDAAGVLAHHLNGVDRIEEAMTSPPAEGRASLRGSVIARGQGSNRYLAAWDHIVDTQGRQVLNLTDPFETVEQWKHVGPAVEEASDSGRGAVSRVAQALREFLG